jgi:hypothetical protein
MKNTHVSADTVRRPHPLLCTLASTINLTAGGLVPNPLSCLPILAHSAVAN